jgi:hypothetical protein
MIAASVFGTGVAALRAVPLVRGLARACVRGEPMFFAMKFCHGWRTTDFAFAFAHHFSLPPVLPRHVRTPFSSLYDTDGMKFSTNLRSCRSRCCDPAAKKIGLVPQTIHPFDSLTPTAPLMKVQLSKGSSCVKESKVTWLLLLIFEGAEAIDENVGMCVFACL